MKRLDFEFMRFYSALASHFSESMRKADQNIVMLVMIEEDNLLRALRFAESNNEWEGCQTIAHTVYLYYEIAGRMGEWESLRDRLLSQVGEKILADADRERTNLWMFLLGVKANAAFQRNDLTNAEAAHQSILDYLLALPGNSLKPEIAASYNELGIIAQQRQQLDKAEERYKKALEIFGHLGLEQYVAIDYHNLGLIAEDRKLFDRAEQWYEKALEVRKRLGLERDAATDYHQLGNIAMRRQDFDNAEQWYKKALEISKRLRLEQDAADEYHQLGRVAQERQDFGNAEQWYKKALEIYECLGLKRDAARAYHHLGVVAQMHQDFDKAEQWYKKTLEIFEHFGNLPLFVNTFAQFGMLRWQQGRFSEAVLLLGKALAIAAEYKMQVGAQILEVLAQVMKSMGETEFAAAWNQVFPEQVPPFEKLREIVRTMEQGDKL